MAAAACDSDNSSDNNSCSCSYSPWPTPPAVVRPRRGDLFRRGDVTRGAAAAAAEYRADAMTLLLRCYCCRYVALWTLLKYICL